MLESIIVSRKYTLYYTMVFFNLNRTLGTNLYVCSYSYVPNNFISIGISKIGQRTARVTNLSFL